MRTLKPVFTFGVVTVAIGGEGNIDGAAYIPVEEIGPLPTLPPAMPFTCHVTFVFAAPVTVAVNCCVCPNKSVMLDWETVIITDGGGGGGGGGDPPEVLPRLTNKIWNALNRAANKISAHFRAEEEYCAN